MIELRQIRYFIAVAETLHFGRAAERLHVTQPPLSRQVAALEKALGVKLIERHSRRARLTPAGEGFLNDAREVLAGLDQACRNAVAAQAGEKGDLTIGFMMHAAYSSVPTLTRRFMARWPDVRLHLRETLPSDLAKGVVDGRFDAAIGFDPGAVRGLRSRVLHRETLCLAAPADHPLAGRTRLTARDLQGEPLIASPVAVIPTLRKAILDWLSPQGEPVDIRLETQLQQTIVSLVAEGIGIALVPQSLARLGLAGVVFRPIASPPMVEQVLMWRNGAANPSLAHLLSMVGEQAL
jgi:DNA-binding transcriptional LysR family regulator